jgi:mRNA interferase RelE/StbE
VNYDVELSRIALKNMTKIPKRELIRIQDRIDSLVKEPKPADVKKIQGDENLYRIRSGDYRILYRVFDSKFSILIVDIDHRKDIYRCL